MVMRWYENGSAAEYLSRKNPAADRVALVGRLLKSSAPHLYS